MERTVKIAPSLLSADYADLKASIERVSSADLFHLDVMDGTFVPNITFGPLLVEAMRRLSAKPFEIHLMIQEPMRYVSEFAKAAGNRNDTTLIVHYEACADLKGTIRAIKEKGMRAGVSIKPGTPQASLVPFLPDLDHVLVMTVEPGFGGQSFMHDQVPKLSFFKELAEEGGFAYDIGVDGGIGRNTIQEARAAGANVFVAGSAVFGSVDANAEIKALKELCLQVQGQD
ncbi:MAG TPA: ribulose-phosphate 3-epimerase [archaeon]|nr:ribulose-phosphate 3-epimerase [archaeon]HLD80610.1 ribulose-phosphate 3-epimerase [archaeon]